MSIVLAPVRRDARAIWRFITLLLVRVSGIGAWMLSRSLTRPIRELVVRRRRHDAPATNPSASPCVAWTSLASSARRSTPWPSASPNRGRRSARASPTTSMPRRGVRRAAAPQRRDRLERRRALRMRVDEHGDVPRSNGSATTSRAFFGYESPTSQAPRLVVRRTCIRTIATPASLGAPPGRRSFDGAHEYRFRHKDGQYRWLREERRVVHGRGRLTRIVVCAWLDITEQRQLADRLRQTQKMEAVGRSPAASRTTSTTCSP